MFKSVLTLLLLAGAAAASTVAQPSTGARMRVPPAVAPGAQGAAAAGVMAGPYANSMGMMMGAGSMGAGMMGAGAGMMGPGAAGPGGMGPGPGAGAGLGAGGMGVGGMGMAACGDGDANQCPMQVWMELLMNHDKVERAFTPTASGIESVTTSLDPAVARLIQTHVAQMAALLAACRAAPAKGAPACPGVRRWDPLFAAVFDNAKDITLQVRMHGRRGAA